MAETVTPRTPVLKRLPPGVWVGTIWLTIILVRWLQRPDEPSQLVNFDGNMEDGALLVTAVVSTAVTLLMFRLPLVALAVALAGYLAALPLWVIEAPVVQFLLADVVVGYTTATRSRRWSVPALLMPFAVLAAEVVWRMAQSYRTGLAVQGAMASTTVIAWLIGNTLRQSRAHAEALQSRATEQAVTAERLRIARELHDSVAHSIGIIAIQAGVGSRVMDTQPAETRKSLDAIEATSRETLAGLRRLLGAMRQSDGDGAPLDPAPGLADVERLVATTGDAGVRVDVRWRGARRPLPADIDLSAFRIIQEAVTNVVRHSGTRDCSVTVDYRDEDVSIEVIDLGCGITDTTPGYGIVGMRERVTMLHGDFSAGPRPEGGFRVAARLPVPLPVEDGAVLVR
ncbi:sensor histidine kinase [Streptomyces sp. NPDC051976]|uniref:sensor histidine kinase n=1 Tax=Streptomyces sp. NPDC051976 TaxID=3154947 RepID=UPI0034435D12